MYIEFQSKDNRLYILGVLIVKKKLAIGIGIKDIFFKQGLSSINVDLFSCGC